MNTYEKLNDTYKKLLNKETEVKNKLDEYILNEFKKMIGHYYYNGYNDIFIYVNDVYVNLSDTVVFEGITLKFFDPNGCNNKACFVSTHDKIYVLSLKSSKKIIDEQFSEISKEYFFDRIKFYQNDILNSLNNYIKNYE